MLGVRNAFVPEWNILGGTQYLSRLLKRYGNEALALAAYNAGDVPVQRYGGIPPYSETQNYVRRVLSLKKQYTAVAHG
jgi:soluble lytic murein transglycosylase-like protein